MAIKEVIPESALSVARRLRMRFRKAKVKALPALTEDDFLSMLTDRLGLTDGDTVLVHSSMDQLHLAFPFGRILALVRRAIGEAGTMMFPTYPGLPSYEFLASGKTFDVRKEPSYMGILTEFARRQRDAVRSLHPTKSVCAIGPLARELTGSHRQSRYPFDRNSPYYKLVERGGKIIGLGVSSERNSFVHCVEDVLQDDFPVRTYHDQLFAARCIDADGKNIVVETYAHKLHLMNHDIPTFMQRHVSADACVDLKIKGMKFFKANAAKLLAEMTELAARGITIYPRELVERDLA